MSIAINRYGVIDTDGPARLSARRHPAGDHRRRPRGLPQVPGRRRHLQCQRPEIRPHPFPAEGKLYAFNGEVEGKPAILAHVYGVRPAPTSFTLDFLLTRSKGTFGTTLQVNLPR